ncbi:MAG: YiaA/YiaB family inner membrane protein [Bacillota bacterium]|nr:YiaA/YiaB family inner membrane protein [Bacillota bacterium]
MGKRKRNTQHFTFLAWAAFSIFTVLMFIGLYTLKEPLFVKGYYTMGTIGIIVSSFMVAKVVRDTQEDLEDSFYEEEIKSKKDKLEG